MMRIQPVRALTAIAAAILAVTLTSLFSGSALAQQSPIKIESSSVTSEFPAGFRIKVEASAENPIELVAVRIRIGLRTRGIYDYLCQDKPGQECGGESATVVGPEMFWRTNTGARYIPPGTIITYNFEVEDSEGNRLETEQEKFIYQDARFEWKEVSDGPVTVAYYGPVKTRAEIVLKAITDTLAVMGPILGADTSLPIRVTMYVSNRDMIGALPPGSTTIRRELVTEGQAFGELGTLLVLGGGRMAEGTASHEVTHILVDRGGRSIFRTIPPWLNEGLAEYGNIAPGFSYDIALEFAVATNRLMPVMFMDILPGDPEDVIIFYGQARGIIRYMIREFGRDKMTELMAAAKSGVNMDQALKNVYGFDRLEMDNLWRESIDAPAYVPAAVGRVLPTPLPARTILPYSLTPQAQAEVVGSKAEEPTPTPTSEPTPEPTHTPTAVPEPEPAAVLAPPSPAPAALAPQAQPEDEQPSGGGTCSAPRDGSGPLDLTGGLLMMGLVGLVARRRLTR